MKTNYLFGALFFVSTLAIGQKELHNRLTDIRLRVDIIIRGTDKSAVIEIEGYAKEPHFSTPSKSYIDSFLYGQYLFELEDIATKEKLFSNGFSSLFNEWQSTPQAKKSAISFGKTLIMPMPIKSAILRIYNTCDNKKTEILNDTIRPNLILSNPRVFKPKSIYYRGPSVDKLDILILGDGYAKNDKADFYISAKAFADSLLAVEPYKRNRKKINFWAICPTAKQTGISYNRQTSPLGCAYNAIESDRYLYSTKNREIADVASQTPYDQIVILTNSSKYGGGGIYNDFAVAAAGGQDNFKVMIHEFGHTFAGLGDEYSVYSTKDTTTYYSPHCEPWEPNITNLVNFDKKWKWMLNANAPIPTPDSLAKTNTIGVYEGAGYQAKGIYRPSYNCRMRTTEANDFCPVCQDIINRKIKSYTK